MRVFQRYTRWTYLSSGYLLPIIELRNKSFPQFPGFTQHKQGESLEYTRPQRGPRR